MFGAIGRRLATAELRQSAIYIGAALLNAAVPFLIMPILTRALGPSEYGMVGTFTAMSAIAAVVLGLSTQGFLSVRYFVDDARHFREAIAACFAVLGLSLVVVAPLVALMSPWISAASQIPPRWQWTIIAVGAGQFLMSIALTAWQVRGRAAKFAALQVGTTITNIALTLLLVLVFAWGWEGRALASVAATLGAGILGTWLLWRHDDIGLFRADEVRRALRFGIPLLPHALANLAMTSADRIIVASSAGSYSAGIYFAASQLCSIISIVALAAIQAWAPWLYRQLSSGTDEAKRRVKHLTWMLLGLIAGLTLIFILISPWLVSLLAGETYRHAAQLIPLLAIAAALQATYYLFANYLFYVGRTELLSMATFGLAIVQLSLTFLLVGRLGPMGAALSAAVAQTLYVGLIFVIAARYYPMSWFGRS